MKSCIENSLVSCSRMHYLMDTFCSIQTEGEDSAGLEGTIEEAFAELKRIEALFSRYEESSEIFRMNQEASQGQVKVNPEVFQLLTRAMELSSMTSGAFDITLGKASDFWRRLEENNILPKKEEINWLKTKIGYRSVILDANTQTVYFSKVGLKLDFGALAKGYALDRAVAILRAKGIKKAQINLGGNIYVIGNQPQAIGIRNPLIPEEIIEGVSLADTSISTSANYERFFTIANKRLSHLLNPLTASPVKSDILSVSVISQDATLADTLSTALFVLGLPKARKMLEAFSGVEAVIIYKCMFGRQLKVYKLKGGR